MLSNFLVKTLGWMQKIGLVGLSEASIFLGLFLIRIFIKKKTSTKYGTRFSSAHLLTVLTDDSRNCKISIVVLKENSTHNGR